ncbi:hypothetical protein PG997_001977 [Apiospora hydei]|uniref:Uncharacterized protein n=1 Tax=Apiospora hydei TaxID=1337664 RepID=A0ABR1X822_9PEZI
MESLWFNPNGNWTRHLIRLVGFEVQQQSENPNNASPSPRTGNPHGTRTAEAAPAGSPLGVEVHPVQDDVDSLLDPAGHLGLPRVGVDVVEDDVERIQDPRVGPVQPAVFGGHGVHAADVVDDVVGEVLLLLTHQGVPLRLVAGLVVIRLPVTEELVQSLYEDLLLIEPVALLGAVSLHGVSQSRKERQLLASVVGASCVGSSAIKWQEGVPTGLASIRHSNEIRRSRSSRH